MPAATKTKAGGGVPNVRSLRREMRAIWSQLEPDYQQWYSRYRELAESLEPMKSQFYQEDHQGTKESTFNEIMDNTATLAGRTAASGLHSSMTSPASPWYKLGVKGQEELSWESRKWIDDLTADMRQVHAQSNLYKLMPQFYESDVHFATAAMLAEPHPERVIHFTELPLGSYRIANDPDGRVNVFAREFQMTVRQVVEEFAVVDAQGNIDWMNISPQVRRQWDLQQWENKVNITHVITPNPRYSPGALDAKFKRYLSCYYEAKGGAGYGSVGGYGGSIADDVVLKETGYDLFPVLVMRWKVRGPQDAYGSSCPGIMSLGDVKGLQQLEKVSLQAIEKQANPPLVGPEPTNGIISTLPGHHTIESMTEGRQGLRPLYQVAPDIVALEGKAEQTRGRINRAYYVSTFQALTNLAGGQKTVPEVQELKAEKLVELGGVLEQFNFDFGDPLIDLSYAYMLMFNRVRPAPEELSGATLEVEYISILAQAMKLSGIEGIERWWGFSASVATGKGSTEPLDVVDTDALLRHYGDMASVPADVVLPADKVAEIRAARAQQQQTLAAAQAIQAGAGVVKDLAASPTNGPNALTALLGRSRAGSLVPAA